MVAAVVHPPPAPPSPHMQSPQHAPASRQSSSACSIILQMIHPSCSTTSSLLILHPVLQLFSSLWGSLVERPLGSDGDDTALNAIRLYCASPSTRDTQETITSSESSWGDWTPVSWCPSGHLMSFALQVEPKQGDGDDTAANNIMMQCSDHTVLTGKGGYWGTFGSWSWTCPSGICGIQTRVEGKQGRGDDTALNDVKFGCC
ncbi:hypothetical protein GDO81_029313 [Engystomops pustulosus]|uniref:Vitelline membrane outer layer protein 1 homolog n=1 Tax=Engystomops pustulosus TaxID=76066 RepID=A0AAV6ZCU6_ENGPU|nr:hypothetical protein GDO81_029313 [Engystomops pustulosus]